MSRSHVIATPPSGARPHRAVHKNGLLTGLSLLAGLGFIAGLYMALVFAGPDSVQGDIQRIFYIHLGAFLGATVSYGLAVVGGIAYLRTRGAAWNTLGLCSVEVGLVLTVITLTTGVVWGRPMWNTWWTWDSRLTSTAIVALVYGAYLMFRNGLENPHRRRVFASVYSIVAITTVFFTFIVTRIRPDTIHPIVIGPSATRATDSFSMTANMGIALGVNVLVWCLLITPALIWWRIRLENSRQQDMNNLTGGEA